MDSSIQTKKVIVFTTPSCSWCTRVKEYFRKKGIRFREIDVSKDRKAAEDMVRKTGQQGVPVILINGRPIIGFDQNKIERFLK
ncbi:MAG: glutathione S-transferase N-terminal domain-containing protein [Spirochaetes bacterium]|nr:glutathione S-transferase N-terminal domain-containing protein [Spirochaetota bacterium]